LGLKGISIFAASGDSGANGEDDGICSAPVFFPQWPATSPYVTAVGATQLQDAQMALANAPEVCAVYNGTCASGGMEVAVDRTHAGFTSGGGFSNISLRPAFQDAAISAYLNSGVRLPAAHYYNASGRAIPDVAAMGNNFLVYDTSDVSIGWETVGGTSASTPVWAALASKLSQLSLSKTGKPIGPMTQMLYKMYAESPQAFIDVTQGSNWGWGGGCTGFNATAGWDPVTGLGTPLYAELVRYVSSILDVSVERARAHVTV